MKDVETLLKQAIANVTPENWYKRAEHVRRTEERFIEQYCTQDDIEPIVIYLGGSDTEESNVDLNGDCTDTHTARYIRHF